MSFTSDACWFLLIRMFVIKNNKKREASLKNEAGGDEKYVVFLLCLIALFWNDNSESKYHKEYANGKVLFEIIMS